MTDKPHFKGAFPCQHEPIAAVAPGANG